MQRNSMKQLFKYVGLWMASVLFLPIGLFAQISGEGKLSIVTSVPTAGMEVCGASQTFSLTLKNNWGDNANPVTLNELTINVVLPQGIVLDETAPAVTNATFVGFAQDNKGRPIFSVAQMAPEQELVITYKAKALCEIITTIRQANPNANSANVQNATTITYKINNVNYQDAESGGVSTSYNIRTADIDVFIEEQFASLEANIGDDVTRKIKVRNSGLGFLTSFKLYVEYPTTAILQQQSLKIGTLTLTPVSTIAPNTLVYEITNFANAVTTSGSNGNPAIFESNELLEFTEVVRVKQCASVIRTDFIVKWGCENTVCNPNQNNAAFVAYISIPDGFPQLQMTKTFLSPTDLCGTTEGKTEFVITNTAAPGNNNRNRALNVDLWFNQGGRFWPDATFITNIEIYVANQNGGGSFVPLASKGITLTRYDYSYWYVYLSSSPAALNTDIDGPGGLDDLDKDGYFDDLAPGQSIKYRMKDTPACLNNLSCDGINYSYFNGMYIGYVANRCLSATGGTFLDLGNNTYMRLFANPAVINGPEEMFSGETASFSFNTNLYLGELAPAEYLNCTYDDQNYTSTFTLPAGYSLVPNSLKWKDVLLTPAQYSVNGQVVTATLGGQGTYTMSLAFNCGATAIPEISTIQWEMKYRCSQICNSCDHTIMCSSFEIYNYCVGQGTCNTMFTPNFEMKRSTYGWDESNMGNGMISYQDFLSRPKVTASTPGIDLTTAMPYDEISAAVEGKLLGTTSYAFTHAIFQYNTTVKVSGVNTNVLNFVSGVVKLNGVQCATMSAPTTTIVGDLVIIDFKIPATACSVVPNATVLFEVKFRVANVSPDVSQELFPLSRLRGSVRVSNDGINTVYCNTKGAKLRIFTTQFSERSVDADMTCKGVLKKASINFDKYGVYDYFPNEFRPVYALRKVSIPYDPILQFQLGSSKYYYYIYGCCGFTTTNVMDPQQSGTGDYVWDFSSPEKASSRFVAEPRASQVQFEANFTRACANRNQPLANYNYSMQYDKFVYADPAFIQTITYSPTSGTNSFIQDYSKANLTILPEALQEGYKAEVSWKVFLKNPSTSEKRANADRTWLAIEPTVPNIEITGATLNGTALSVQYYGSPIRNAMLQIGNVPLNTTQEIVISARYTNCIENKIDNITLKAGWVCENKDYPTTPNDPLAACNDAIATSQLQLRYKNTDLGHEFNRVSPIGNVSVCTQLTYQALIKSTGYSDLNNIRFTAKLAEGINYIPGSATYTYDGQVDMPLAAPTLISPNEYEWNLSAMAPLNNPALGASPGEFGSGILPGSRLEGKEVIIIKFKAEPKCDVDAGNSLVTMRIDANTNCGNARTISFDDKMDIEGFTPLDKMAVTVTCNSFGTDNLAFIAASATNIGNVTLGQVLPAVKRYFLLTLPSGIFYEPGTSSKGEPVKTTISSRGENIYWWLLPALSTSAPGNNFPITFKIRKANFNVLTSGNRIPVTVSTIMYDDNIYCASQNTNCTMIATTAKASCIIIVNTKLCETCNGSFAPTPGSKYVLSVWVKEAARFNSSTSPTYTNSAITLFFGGANVTLGPFYPKGEIIDGWQRIEEVFTIPENVTTVEIRLDNRFNPGVQTINEERNVFFDDLRIHPFNSNMKSFVYDPFTLRLSAELDENNYATLYEYDQEGGLIRVKKETEKGIMTIQESRSNNVKK